MTHLELADKMSSTVYLNRRCKVRFVYQSPDYHARRPYYHYYADVFYRVPVRIFGAVIYYKWIRVGSYVFTEREILLQPITPAIVKMLFSDREKYKTVRRQMYKLKQYYTKKR